MSKKKPTHLDEMLEWQEHQYDPVYYTDGKIPPYLKAKGKPSWAAVWWFSQAALALIVYFVITYRVIFFGEELPGTFYDYKINSFWTIFILTVIFLFLFWLSMRLGIRYWQKHKNRKHKNYQKSSTGEGQKNNTFHKIL